MMRAVQSKKDYHVISASLLSFNLPLTFGYLSATSPMVVPEPTELEGDWRQVAHSDGEGDTNEKHIHNRTFNGNLSSVTWKTGREEGRIEVDPIATTIRVFRGNPCSHLEEQYELQRDRLVILKPRFVEGDRITVYERGHIPFLRDDRLLFAPAVDAVTAHRMSQPSLVKIAGCA